MSRRVACGALLFSLVVFVKDAFAICVSSTVDSKQHNEKKRVVDLIFILAIIYFS